MIMVSFYGYVNSVLGAIAVGDWYSMVLVQYPADIWYGIAYLCLILDWPSEDRDREIRPISFLRLWRVVAT